MAFQKRSFKPKNNNGEWFRVTGMFKMSTNGGKRGFSGTPDRETAEKFYEHLGNILEKGKVPRFTVWDNGDRPGALTCGEADEQAKQGFNKKSAGFKKPYQPTYQRREEREMNEPIDNEPEDGYEVVGD